MTRAGEGSARAPSLVRALNHPIRVQILRFMRSQGPGFRISPKGLSKKLGRQLNLVSYHVRILEDDGAVRLLQKEPARGAVSHFYVFDIQEPWALAMLDASETDPGKPGAEDHADDPSDRGVG